MTCQVLTRAGLPDLAYDAFLPDLTRPVFLFLSGYRSDMNGNKAQATARWARDNNHNLVRFDYTGHGGSGGKFADTSLSDWLRDADDILNAIILPQSPVVVIGSSMGGWLALHLALKHSGWVRAVVGLAAAPDFTPHLYQELDPAHRQILDEKGIVELPSAHGPDPYIITWRLIEDGSKMLLLNRTHDLRMPLVLFQGGLDPTVSPETPDLITRAFPHADVTIHSIDDADHGLSRPQDLARIFMTLTQLENQIISGGN